MLPCTRLGNDAFFTQLLGQNDLSYRIVDLVCAGVAEVFALEVDLGSKLLREPGSQIQRRRAPYKILQKALEFFLVTWGGYDGLPIFA